VEDLLLSLLSKLAVLGPGFIVAAIFAILFWLERKKSEKLADRLFDLGMSSIRSDIEHTQAIRSLEKTLDSVERRIQ
jgi:hypothetical protein